MVNIIVVLNFKNIHYIYILAFFTEPNHNSNKVQKLNLYIKILSLIGIILAIYLIWQQISRPAFQVCSINSTINCDAIISGPVSKTLDIPTPLYGLAGYIIIFIAAYLKKRKIILAAASFGLVFCLWIFIQEVVLLKVICPICIICQLIMISVFYLSLLINRRR